MVLVKFKAALSQIASVRLTRHLAGDANADNHDINRGGRRNFTSSRGFGASGREEAQAWVYSGPVIAS